MVGRTQFRINLLCLPRHSLEHRIRAQRVEVGSSVVERAHLRDVLELDVGVELELASESLDNLELRVVVVAHTEVQHAIEPIQNRQSQSKRRGGGRLTFQDVTAQDPTNPVDSSPQ
jgi:hypothetical protein